MSRPLVVLEAHKAVPGVATALTKAPFQSRGINFSFLLNFSYMN
jgi:hypothetical protein